MSSFNDPSGIIIRDKNGKIVAITDEKGDNELDKTKEEKEAEKLLGKRDATRP